MSPANGSALFDVGPLFDDGKAPDALRTIGEVAKALGIRQHVLRYWEDQFPMLRPLQRNGGRRYYRPEDVHLVQSIDRLVHHEGYTLRGARLAIEAGAKKKSAPITAVAVVPATAVAADVARQLRTIRDKLAAALAAS